MRGGRLRAFARLAFPRDDRKTWRVEGYNGTPAFFTDRECHALCYGLASAQYGQERKERETQGQETTP